jgi:hypothetical protein
MQPLSMDLFSLLEDAHARGYGHTSPHRGPYPPPPPNRRAPQDPHTFDYPASLKQYAEWFRYFYPQQAQEEDTADKAAEQEAGDGSKPRNGIRSRWEKYKKDFASQQVSTLHSSHACSCFREFHCWVLVSVFARLLRCFAKLCCHVISFSGCLSIIGSHHGLQKSTTHLLSLCSFVPE